MTVKTKTTAKEIASNFMRECNARGWKIQEANLESTIIKITKSFEPGNLDEFCKADSEYFSLISMIPQTSSGSYWGTDGGGVGAVSAHQNGYFVYNMSGASKRVINQIKLLQFGERK